MLSKLFKHEIRATARTFMWLYIAFAIIAIVGAFLAPWSSMNIDSRIYYQETGPGPEAISGTVPGVLQTIMFVLYILAVITIGIVTIVVIILRFYRNLLGDEGYLMMTLPVSREENILAKLIVAFIWSICTTIIIILSILLFVAVSGYFGELAKAVNEMLIAGAPLGRWIVMLVLTLIVSTASGILMLYAAMAIGPNLLKNRVGGSILSFIIIYVASQFISVGIMFAVARPMNAVAISSEVWDAGEPSMQMGYGIADKIVSMGAGASIISCVIVGVACWFLTRYMLKKKLNLA